MSFQTVAETVQEVVVMLIWMDYAARRLLEYERGVGDV